MCTESKSKFTKYTLSKALSNFTDSEILKYLFKIYLKVI